MLVAVIALVVLLSLIGVAIHAACCFWLVPQNLALKYGASWALVTGSSSGIGFEVVKQLATDGLNVVLVALPDVLLDERITQLRDQFPGRLFRKVAVDLSDLSGDYLPVIAKATEDIPIQLIFNNAGYTKAGYFQQMAVTEMRKLMECNANAAMAISHLFVNRMVRGGLRGCVVFTSSMSAHMVGPLVTVYNASKACLSMFAANLAIELHQQGIDVLAVCPGPVLTRFFDQEHRQPSIKFMKRLAMDPAYLVRVMLAAVGRTVILEVGSVSLLTKLLMRWLDFNVFTLLASRLYKYSAESRAFEYKWD